VKKAMTSTLNFCCGLLDRFLEPRQHELSRGTFYQEQARSERLTNLVRFCFVLMWTILATFWAIGNEPQFAVLNLGVGVLWMTLTVLYHLWLARYSACTLSKFYSTTVDMMIVALLMFLYARTQGPAFVFKMPVFINFFYALGFAALRFDRNLVLYATSLAVSLLGGLWLWTHLAAGIEYGSLLEHSSSGKLSFFYMADILVYTGMFGFLTAIIVMNLRRQMDLRVSEAGRAAREEERALMAAGLAHEIRNPLAGIYGFASLIRDEGKADSRHSAAILNDALRLNGVVEDFLRYSRPFPVRPAEVELISVVSDFCRQQNPIQVSTPIEFRAEAPKVFIRTDADAVRQILLNLLQNARRFQRPGQSVKVRAGGSASTAFVHVEDDGPGVSPEILPRLFEPFQTSGEGGSGLGLTFSRKIARELGGDVIHMPRFPGARFVLQLRPMVG
jgi:signal transduction histidine kinase